MGKKKNPFIDKKNASTYQLIHRSQRDVGGLGWQQQGEEDEGEEDARVPGGGAEPGLILWPTNTSSSSNNGNNNNNGSTANSNLEATDRAVLFHNNNNANSTSNSDDNGAASSAASTRSAMAAWRSKLAALGLLDEADHERYLRPITGTGTFLDARTGRPVAPNQQQQQQQMIATTSAAAAATTSIHEEALVEVHRQQQLDSIALTADCMDEDIAAALFGDFDADDYEELNDDFILDAAAVNGDGDASNNDNSNDNDNSHPHQQQAFDFDAHIQQLVAKAKRERSDAANVPVAAAGQHGWGQRDQAYFRGSRPLHERDDDNDDDDHYDNYDDHDGEYDDGVDYGELVHGAASTATNGHAASVAPEPGVAAKLSPAEERALCEKFEATLAEYDDDAGDDDDESASDDDDGGDGDARASRDATSGALFLSRPLEGDAVVEAALDDFLQEREDEIFMQGTRHRNSNNNNNNSNSNSEADNHNCKGRRGGGGSGFSVLVGKQMVQAKDLDAVVAARASADGNEHPEQEPALPLEEYLAAADLALAQPKQRPPPEEIFIDGGASYFSERERNPWDCESILSTYSNLDNNPVTVDGANARRRRRRTHKGRVAPVAVVVDEAEGEEEHDDDEPTQLIRLSAKTGLPIGVFDKPNGCNFDGDDDGFDDTAVSINRGVARSKHETPEEKKARKLLVRRERELARIQKKMTREVYAEEFQKRAVGDDDMAGKTIFRFS